MREGLQTAAQQRVVRLSGPWAAKTAAPLPVLLLGAAKPLRTPTGLVGVLPSPTTV